MISFKRFLLIEEFKKIASGKKGMWKNPTKKEYSDIPAGVRAVVDHQGNMYVADEKIRFDRGSGFSDNHVEVSRLTKKLWPKIKSFDIGMLSGDYTNSLSLVRVGNKALFKIGRDEWASVWYKTDEDISDPLHKKRIQLMKKASKKNEAFSFKYKPISDEDDQWTR